MNKILTLSLALTCGCTVARAQSNAMQFSGTDCNGNNVDLFADLDAGKAVVLHFYMPNCGSCPPPAQKIQAMADAINAEHPGMVKGYAFPYQNSTTCAYSSSWVSTNNLGGLYAPMDSGATQVAYYGGFGMPTVVLLGGTDHRVMFVTQSFSTADTALMADSIMNLLEGPSGVGDLMEGVGGYSLYPNPARDVMTMELALLTDARVRMELTDLTGRTVVLMEERAWSGRAVKELDLSGMVAGEYVARLHVNGRTLNRKVTIAR